MKQLALTQYFPPRLHLTQAILECLPDGRGWMGHRAECTVISVLKKTNPSLFGCNIIDVHDNCCGRNSCDVDPYQIDDVFVRPAFPALGRTLWFSDMLTFLTPDCWRSWGRPFDLILFNLKTCVDLVRRWWFDPLKSLKRYRLSLLWCVKATATLGFSFVPCVTSSL